MEGENDQPILLIVIFLSIFFAFFSNGIGLTVTKNASSLYRAILNVLTPFAVWIITIGLGWDIWDNCRLGGFLVITLGCLIYYEIIVIPVFGFNQNIYKKLQERKLQIEK